VTLVTDLQQAGDAVSLPVDRPVLRVQVSPSRIRGLGLEEAEVRVQLEGAAGPATVTVSAEDGHLDPGSVRVTPGAVAMATIRSRGWGPSGVTATRPSFVGGTATIEYYFPTLFLVLTVLGGLVGGLLRALQTKGGEHPVGKARVAVQAISAWHDASDDYPIGPGDRDRTFRLKDTLRRLMVHIPVKVSKHARPSHNLSINVLP